MTQGTAWYGVLGLACVMSVACGQQATPTEKDPWREDGALSSGPLADVGDAESDELAVRAAHVTTRQADGERESRFHWVRADETLVARNSEFDFGAEIGGGRLRLTSSQGEFDVTLSARGVRCAETWLGFDDARPGVARGAHRVELPRTAGTARVTEWYVNGPLGLEQGFTLESSPCSRGELELAVEMSVAGRTPVAASNGRAVVLAAETFGVPGLRLQDLYVLDATGRVLPSRFEARGDRVAIRVGLAGATFPITVDPLVVTQEAKLMTGGALHASSGDTFGSAVAISGTLIAVGARNDAVSAANQGSAYVFQNSSGTWRLDGWLVAPDGAAGDQFGAAVDIDGTSVAVGARNADGAFGNQGSAYVFTRSGTTWSLQQKVSHADPAQDDNFGSSVSIAGTTLAVGASQKAISWSKQGAAYVFARSGTTWSQQAKLTAADGSSGHELGTSVALSGDSLAVGAPGMSVSPGAAYVFVRSGTTWSQQAKLIASDGAVSDMLGFATSIDGDTVAVGAPLADPAGASGQGAAYVFVRSGSTWSQQQKLTQGAAGDRFGNSVSVNGNSVICGAPQVDHTTTNQGRAHVFTRVLTSWSLQSTLTIPYVTGKIPAANDYFGEAVALEGDLAVVGAPYVDYDHAAQGAAAVYTRSGTQWGNGQLLTAEDDASRAGAAVAISGDLALVGAPDENVGKSDAAGTVYVFSRTGTTWSKLTRLQASDGGTGALFGSALALDGKTALIGAPSATVGVNAGQGAAYVFAGSGSIWSEQQKVVASDGAAAAAFGSAVALRGDYAVLGAPLASAPAKNQGAAYVFFRSGSVWSQQQKLVASDGATGDQFGTSVAVATDGAVVGAPKATVSGASERGTAYAFARSGTTWSQQQKLTASDGAAGHLFGESVALSGTTAVVGAPMTTLIDNEIGPMPLGNGAAYVFVRSGSTWSQQAKLTASDGVLGDKLGDGVAIDGETVVLGASRRNTADRRGGAYLFLRSGTTWAPRGTLLASDGAQLDRFGTSVAVSGPLVLIGAPGDDFSNHSSHGSAYAFQAKGVAGQSCAVNDDCDSNYFCVDGVCCTSACPGYCEVCSTALGAVANGSCTVKPAGSTPDQPCAGGALCNGTTGACPSGCTSDANCPANQYCSTAGTCLPSRANGQACNPQADCATPGCKLCASGNCVDGVCCNTACAGGPCDRCDLPTPGTCGVIPKGGTPQSSCNGYLCNGTSAGCGTTCAGATDCASTHYCDNGSCTPKKTKGQDCSAQAECDTGLYCSDGVCCASECKGKCQACKAANKENGTATGDCGAAKKGSNPGTLCVKSSDPCGDQAACSGLEGACAVAAFGTSCGPTTCNGNAVSGKTCDGTGTCIDQQNALCSPYKCQSGACTSPCTADVQCDADYYCTGGFCVTKFDNGKGCAAANECKSGFCVDQVCCDSPCAGQCQACAEIGSVGACKVVAGAPRAPRADCSGAGVCKGQCDGANGQACTFPSTAVPCQAGQCTGDVAQPPGSCDGNGSCALPATKNCVPYGCDTTAGACKTTCASNTDCSQGATCDTNTGQCTTGSATCVDAFTVKQANGQTQSCSPYKCVAGACQQQCSTASDCAKGYDCEQSACVVAEGGADAGTGGSGGSDAGGTGGSATGGKASGGDSSDEGGCGCHVPTEGSRSTTPWLAALALAAAAVRRRVTPRRRPAAANNT
ncbi:MAG: FG-GAP repeat protein [Polyangiaceae bacterium]|nr:FG-GAP repeat protein [Polyangiaceae bacterium]